MDIRKIALYLSGKIAPDYKKFSRLEFYEHLKNIYGFWFDQLDFYWKQAKEYEEELYFLILDYLHSKSSKDTSEKIKFELLLKEIKFDDTPIVEKQDELWKWDYSWKDFELKISELYWAKPSNIQKWDLFGKLSADILEKVGNFVNVRSVWAWADEWIDLTATNLITLGKNTAITFGWLGQCKYKSKWNVQWDEVNRIIRTISEDSIRAYQIVYFFTNAWYAPKARQALESINHNWLNRKAFWFDGDQILDIINSNKEIFEKYLPKVRS